MNLLKNKWVIFIITVVILVAVIAISANPQSPLNFIYKAVSVPLAPVQRFFSAAAGRISDTVSYFFNYGTVDDELISLKEDNERLKQEIREIQHYRDENDELRRLMKISEERSGYTYTTAEVIAYDTEEWYKVFSINKGSSSGIKLYDCVITSKGLAGKVISVAPTSAKVMAIVNEESVLMGRLSKTNDIVRLRGSETLTSEITCKVDRIDENLDIAVGDIIETAESGGVYPKGIMVGIIKEIKVEDYQRYAILEPATDFRRLDKVMVMTKNE